MNELAFCGCAWRTLLRLTASGGVFLFRPGGRRASTGSPSFFLQPRLFSHSASWRSEEVGVHTPRYDVAGSDGAKTPGKPWFYVVDSLLRFSQKLLLLHFDRRDRFYAERRTTENRHFLNRPVTAPASVEAQ